MQKLNHDLERLFSQGADKVHVLADFDGTLTKEFVDGKKTPSLISVLRDQPGYLSSEYQQKAHQLYETYAPYERDASLSLAERKAKMQEWWTVHKELLIASGIKRQHLEKLARSNHIQWRQGAPEFLELMKQMGIPVVVLSSSGIGEVIPMFCEQQGIDTSHMHFVVNKFMWDAEGNAIDFHRPVIHSLNKDETVLRDYEAIYRAIERRTNVLLLGNSTGDLGMITGFDATSVASVGFLDHEEKDRFGTLATSFDHVVVGEGYGSINSMISSLR